VSEVSFEGDGAEQYGETPQGFSSELMYGL
jgi:hypothetical protein